MITDFVQATKNSFTTQQILQMEVQIIRCLNFDLFCTIPASLLESYSVSIGMFNNRDVLFHTCYLIDLNMLMNPLQAMPANLLVISALILSLERQMAESGKNNLLALESALKVLN